MRVRGGEIGNKGLNFRKGLGTDPFDLGQRCQGVDLSVRITERNDAFGHDFSNRRKSGNLCPISFIQIDSKLLHVSGHSIDVGQSPFAPSSFSKTNRNAQNGDTHQQSNGNLIVDAQVSDYLFRTGCGTGPM